MKKHNSRSWWLLRTIYVMILSLDWSYHQKLMPYSVLRLIIFSETLLYEELNILVQKITEEHGLVNSALLSHDYHVLPDFHGNRSPIADPNMTGMVCSIVFCLIPCKITLLNSWSGILLQQMCSGGTPLCRRAGMIAYLLGVKIKDLVSFRVPKWFLCHLKLVSLSTF